MTSFKSKVGLNLDKKGARASAGYSYTNTKT